MFSNQMIDGPALPMLFAWVVESVIVFLLMSALEEFMFEATVGKFGDCSLTVRYPKIVMIILAILFPFKGLLSIPIIASWNLFVMAYYQDSDEPEDDE